MQISSVQSELYTQQDCNREVAILAFHVAEVGCFSSGANGAGYVIAKVLRAENRPQVDQQLEPPKHHPTLACCSSTEWRK